MSAVTVVYAVDDDPSMGRALVRMLDSVGMRAVLFDSAEALLAHGDVAADCIVIDVHLPGLDGIALYEQLAARGRKPPVVFVSGSDEARTRVMTLPGPRRTFLAKPFTAEALVDAVKRLLQEAA